MRAHGVANRSTGFFILPCQYRRCEPPVSHYFSDRVSGNREFGMRFKIGIDRPCKSEGQVISLPEQGDVVSVCRRRFMVQN